MYTWLEELDKQLYFNKEENNNNNNQIRIRSDKKGQVHFFFDRKISIKRRRNVELHFSLLERMKVTNTRKKQRNHLIQNLKT